jgi:hypothetical protein
MKQRRCAEKTCKSNAPRVTGLLATNLESQPQSEFEMRRGFGHGESRISSTRRQPSKSTSKWISVRFFRVAKAQLPGAQSPGGDTSAGEKKEAAFAASREGGVWITPYPRFAVADRETFTVAACLRRCEGGHKPQTQAPPPTFYRIFSCFSSTEL